MSDPFIALLVVFTIFQVKHFVCDYPLQTAYQVHNKGTYGHPGGLIHAGIHGIGTLAVFLAVPPTLALGAALVVAEVVIHYHVDWAKCQISRRLGYTPKDTRFWWAIGADQLVHHLTYVAMAAILVGTMVGTG